MATPDISGFIEGQERLRVQLGRDVAFKVPVTKTWPEGTKLNPDTGEPYDATIKPTSDAWTEVTKRCLLVLKQASPLRPQPDTDFSPAGELSGMDIILDIAWADYEAVEDAAEMSVNGKNYKIVEAKPFSIANVPYRYLIYGEEK